MHTVMARMPDEFVAELDAEYEDRGFRSRSQYIQHILEHRDVIFTDEPVPSDAGERLAAHDEQLADVESRLDDLEASEHTHSWSGDERGN
jgi:metal-responsive CopG/Arc/MetJ family transcriptional regulator